jgi:hypothetical protein
MPKSIRRLAGPGVVTLSNGTDLAAVFDRVRLSVAPLRYGGGLNGNVLASLAAGVPCVMSSVAAEGIEWSAELASAVGDTAGRLAELILWLHGDHVACQDAGDAGIAMIRDDFNEARVAWALQDAIDGRRPEVVRERPLLAAAM